MISLGFPNQTDLLKRPLITGACHLLEDIAALGVLSVSIFIVGILIDLEVNEKNVVVKFF